MVLTSELFGVTIRSKKGERIVETGLTWMDAKEWCQEFNRTMRGTGAVAIPHMLPAFESDPASQLEVHLGVKLGSRDVGMP